MAIQEVNDLITIQVSMQESGYEDKDTGRKFTISSDFLPWNLGVQYCADRDAKLLTLDDAVEFKYEVNGADYFNQRRLTGTLIGFVSDGRAGLRAYVYDPSAEELLDIAAKVSDDDIGYLDITKRSELKINFLNSDRTFIVPKTDLELSVDADKNGDSEYSRNDVVRCLMPNNAAKYAAVVEGKGHNHARVWFYRPKPKPPKGMMRILPVGIGGVEYNFYYVDASSEFGDDGRARGVVHVAQKISRGKKGRRKVASR